MIILLLLFILWVKKNEIKRIIIYVDYRSLKSVIINEDGLMNLIVSLIYVDVMNK